MKSIYDKFRVFFSLNAARINELEMGCANGLEVDHLDVEQLVTCKHMIILPHCCANRRLVRGTMRLKAEHRKFITTIGVELGEHV
jgi:hypothetical protein